MYKKEKEEIKYKGWGYMLRKRPLPIEEIEMRISKLEAAVHELEIEKR